MGARLYVPATGRFLSIDPVMGGNDNRYTYPADPINKLDLDGRMAWWEVALLAASFIPGPVGIAANIISAGIDIARGDYLGAAMSLLGPAGKLARAAYRVSKVANAVTKVTKPLQRVCQVNSFDADTPVLMADGTQAPISEVEFGDYVWATDPTTGEQGPRLVTDLIRHSGPHTMVEIGLADGTIIDATDQHPFWVVGTSTLNPGHWTAAINLTTGSQVQDPDGHTITVSTVTVTTEDLTAFNLTIDDLHTYYAGTPVLVHNCATDQAAKKLGYSKVRGRLSHGQAIYERGRGAKGPRAIGRDVSQGGKSHRGGVWKGADSVEDLVRGRRNGTYNAQLVWIAK